MHRSTAIFLILLRLAIGWHFLVEGWQKVQSHQVGETVTSRPFSSAGYFREAPGPLGQVVRNYAGDPDSEALNRLVVNPIPEGKDPATYPPQDRIPRGLKRDWHSYLSHFKSHYGLNDKQKERADKALEQHEAKVVEWLTYEPPANPADRDKDKRYEQYSSEQTHTYPSGDVKRRMTMAERISEYRNKLAEVKAAAETNWTFGKDVQGAKLRQAKAEAAQMRAGLLADLDKQTVAFKDDLDKVLTAQQKEEGPVVVARPRTVVDMIDKATPYALTAMGACLLVGLFSRTAAFLAAGFLLMTYLAVPAWPWLPSPPANRQGGNRLAADRPARRPRQADAGLQGLAG